jgi:hypothetical protein
MPGQRNSFNGTGDYVEVKFRLAEFRAKHPEGSLQPADPTQPFQVVEIAGQTFIAYTAAAYRTPDDPRPGIGCAWEPFPGKTNFTRDSELQNAETSAWGRAVMAALAADASKGVASAEEVRNRVADRNEAAAPAQPAAASDEKADELNKAKRRVKTLGEKLGMDLTALSAEFNSFTDGGELRSAGLLQLQTFADDLERQAKASNGTVPA